MINAALIGYGYWGPNVAKNLYKNKQYNLKYICDLRQDRLDFAKGLYANDVYYTTSFDEVIADDGIDVVCLVIETSAHYSLAKQVIEAGKHLYVEKPFTDNVNQAIELKKLAKEKGVIIHVDHIMIYHPAIVKIKEIIDAGDLGEIIYMDCSRMNLGKVKNDVSAMWDLSVHDLSIIDYLSNGTEVKTVKSMGRVIYSTKPSVTFITADYGTFMANIKANWVSPIKERKLIIAGTKKMLVYDDVDVLNKLIVYDKGFDVIKASDPMEWSEFVVKTRSGDAIIPQLEVADALYNSLEHFRQCIVDKSESLSGPDAAIRVLKVLEEADKQMTVLE
ncbi:Gfo/Idh/MocA family oxidoreductase [Schaedlerella arabinosiphila]|uniref:Gfo/Idh/MocA family oxidoreductase n=2 Tax=Schaedlerella arabinosiphila TaxID=2044587 RepID=A0A9X5C535_9FIRM|nr:scyllo-inositol 2-dehydrogenase (NAD(+)) [Schaedlerella arabinosiphila]NDO68160.1 Gfo/Idh/MocA family oxidoreductase [Schaedlerella arabinosiphila]